jgi:bifunctional NMN adenylyltransferase/nudix hydrolase
MQEVRRVYDVGVIVGRFQVPALHDAHRDLINHVREEHRKVVIFLGVSPLFVTRENPLDFEARKQMILEEFPDVNVLYVKDQLADEVWSRKLDEQIKDVLTPSQTVVLYGGRDSFIRRYTGKLPTRELEAAQRVFLSGSEIRKEVARGSAKASSDFRRGVVWAAYSRFPTSYQAVDVAVISDDATQLLLGRKPNETKLRFIGGFVDPSDPSLEAAARRETQEEASIAIGDPVYLGSVRVNDWRYRAEPDKILTAMFAANHLSGRPVAADDLAEVRWVDRFGVKATDLMPTHQPLLELVQAKATEINRIWRVGQ